MAQYYSQFHKYKAKKQECKQGHSHPSRKEAGRCNDLSLLQEHGVIRDLEQQPTFHLLEKFISDGKTIRGIKYIADFKYYDNEQETWIVEDSKGFETPVYKLKKKLLLNLLKDTDIKFIQT